MAFALTGFKSYGVRADGAVRPHVLQIAEFRITAANTDTGLDISNSAGTFWTAAIANATYSDMATAVSSLLFNQISGILYQLRSVSGLPAYSVTQSPAAGSYTVTINSDIPDLAFNTGSAPTAYVLVLEWLTIDGAEAVRSDYGSALT